MALHSAAAPKERSAKEPLRLDRLSESVDTLVSAERDSLIERCTRGRGGSEEVFCPASRRHRPGRRGRRAAAGSGHWLLGAHDRMRGAAPRRRRRRQAPSAPPAPLPSRWQSAQRSRLPCLWSEGQPRGKRSLRRRRAVGVVCRTAIAHAGRRQPHRRRCAHLPHAKGLRAPTAVLRRRRKARRARGGSDGPAVLCCGGRAIGHKCSNGCVEREEASRESTLTHSGKVSSFSRSSHTRRAHQALIASAQLGLPSKHHLPCTLPCTALKAVQN